MSNASIVAQAVPEKTQRLENAKILVVEDCADQWLLIGQAMQSCFTEIELVWTATRQQALSYLEDCLLPGKHLPLFILQDLYLPIREESWLLLSQIRSHRSALSSVPIVMLSASDYDDDIVESYSRGVTSYLVKPVEFDEWIRTFRTLKRYWLGTVLLPESP